MRGMLAISTCFTMACSSEHSGLDPEAGQSPADAGPACGNAITEADEVCDHGGSNGKYGRCAIDCQALGPRCGDRTLDSSHELCDDGDDNGTYGHCGIDCRAFGPGCGDGTVDSSHELCDDGDGNGTYGRCAEDCQGMAPHCGDGDIDLPQEDCDDGASRTEICPCDDAACSVCTKDCRWQPGLLSLECAEEINPWVQLVTPTGAWVQWETESAADHCIAWGTTPETAATACGDPVGGNNGSMIHEVELSPLSPETRYYYRVLLGRVLDFVTPAAQDTEAPVRFVVLSDPQQDDRYPHIFSEVIHAGVIDFVSTEVGPDLAQALTAVLVSGDLIPEGEEYDQWQEMFFRPAADLMAHVAFYPVQGNHDVTSLSFRSYFHLPENYGSTLCDEYHWYLDISNVRIIGIDTANPVCMLNVLSWLSETLDAASADPAIDFVFAQFHHPYRSELWPHGDVIAAGLLVHALEDFTAASDKPSVHFFGHTHGFSRGQSRDVRHLWVNAASAGGNIDHWGEYDQVDLDEFSLSIDDYGFVLVDVWAGDDPGFRLRRVSRGDEVVTVDNEIVDDITVHRYDVAPETPVALSPRDASAVASNAVTLSASSFVSSGDR
ncbi:metallophosphoesterase, partial [Myxococcota bacterium]